MRPLEVGPLTLPNRFVMPSMQRGWVRDGTPLPVYIDYFRQRAEGGVGLLNTEACAVDHPASTGRPDAVILSDQTMDLWARCLEVVHAAGGKMFLQIVHEGALRPPGSGPFPDAPTISPSGLGGLGASSGRPCTRAEMEQVLDAFVRGARSARDYGFDGVEIHCAHGLLLDQFLWAQTNLRDDGYGGPRMGDRVRFPAEVIAAVRAEVGADFPISCRISNWKPTAPDAHITGSPEELRVMLSALRAAGVDIFNISVRRFWAPEWPGSGWGLAGWAKSMTDAVVMTVGSVGISIDFFDNMIGAVEAQSTRGDCLGDLVGRFEGGEFDLVGVGRSLLADPHWLRKVRDGDYETLRVFTRAALLETIGGELPEAYST
jgi:2,4-dienoyl-CoA reductase-like NADH-dependent reductase (Old Yellow Enzyme family)